MKRIAILKSDLAKSGKHGGGLEKYTHRLADSFAKKGCEVFLLTTDFPDDAPATAYRVVNLGKKKCCSFFHLLSFDAKCSQWLKANPCDVVFGMDRNYGLETHYRAGNGVHAAYLQHRKALSSLLKRLSFSFNPLHFLILSMEEKTFESPKLQALFTNSYMVKDEILRYYPNVDKEKICTVHNGVEWYEFEKPFQESLANKAAIQKELGLDPNAFQFLFVGNEYQRKGLELLLQALALLKKENFELAVVGKERNEKRFRALAKKLGLENKVKFFGPQKSTLKFYQAADSCVIPSYYDPFANVTVEALALGLFVISSPKNGGSEVLTDERIGCVFSQFSPAALCQALKEALRHPKTKESAIYIREIARPLDFSNQIEKIVSMTLNNT